MNNSLNRDGEKLRSRLTDVLLSVFGSHETVPGKHYELTTPLLKLINTLLEEAKAEERQRCLEERYQDVTNIKVVMDSWYMVPSDKEKGFKAVYGRVLDIQKGLKKSIDQVISAITNHDKPL